MSDPARATPATSPDTARPIARARVEPVASTLPSPTLPSSLQQLAGNQTIQRLRQDTAAPPPAAAPSPAATPPNVDTDNSPLPPVEPAAPATDGTPPMASAPVTPAADPPTAAQAGAASPATPQGGSTTVRATPPKAAAGGTVATTGTHAAGGATTAQAGGAAVGGATAHPGGKSTNGPARGATAAGAGVLNQGGGAADIANSGLASAETGDLALIDEELAEHQRWSQASSTVGAAESSERAAFIAEQAGAGFTEALGGGFAQGLAAGAGSRAALKVTDIAVRRFGGRIAGGAAKFTPVPAVGAIIGGAFAAYGLAKRDWGETGQKIGRFGQGASPYETIANTIDAISETIDVATNILNVIAGICGLIAAGLWVAAVVTAGVLSPLAGILTEVALAIGGATMVLDGVNAGVLHPVSLAFRALHTFTSDADPQQVEADGSELASAAGASGGALGGYAAGKLAHVGAKRPSQHPEPGEFPDHPTPAAKGGAGPSVTSTPPEAEGHAPSKATSEHADASAPPAEPAQAASATATEPDAHATTAAHDPNAQTFPIEDAGVKPAMPATDEHATASKPSEATSAARPTAAAAPQQPAQGFVPKEFGMGAPPPDAVHASGTPVPGQPEAAFIPAQAELNKPWMYNEQVPDRGSLGRNVQRDHVISQQKIRDQMMVDPQGKGANKHLQGILKEPDLNSLTVLQETGKATATQGAEPHTKATFLDPQADVPEINRLRNLNKPANWGSDIIEPSRDARLRSGYDPHAVDQVLVDQMGRLHEQYRNTEIDPVLQKLENAEAGAGRARGPDTDLGTLHGQLDQVFADNPPPTPMNKGKAMTPQERLDMASNLEARWRARKSDGSLSPEQQQHLDRLRKTPEPAPAAQAEHPGPGTDAASNQQAPGSLNDAALNETVLKNPSEKATAPQASASLLDEVLKDAASKPPAENSPRKLTGAQILAEMLDESSKPWNEVSVEEFQRRQQVVEDFMKQQAEARQPVAAPEPEHIAASPSEKSYGMADPYTSPTRSNTPLTLEQRLRIREWLAAHGVPRDKIKFHNGPTQYVPGSDVVNIGPNVNPLPLELRPKNLPNPANAAIGWEGTLAHEVIGHRQAALANQTRDPAWHEELQASARAGLTPDLPRDQMHQLLQDSAARRRFAEDPTAKLYVYIDDLVHGNQASGPAQGGGSPPPGARPQDVLPKVMVDPSLLRPTEAAGKTASPSTAAATTPVTPKATPPAMPLEEAALPHDKQPSLRSPTESKPPPTGTPQQSLSIPGSTATGTFMPSALTNFALGTTLPALTMGMWAARQVGRRRDAFVRGFQEGREPIVTHVNPSYTPPPVMPEQIVDVQNEILKTLAARAQAESEAARMGSERTQHQANQAPLKQAAKEMHGAQTAVNAHEKAVQRRAEANKAQQERQKKAGGLLAGAPDKLAGLSVITVPLGLFLNLTQYAYLLPEGKIRNGMTKMDTDSRKLLASFDKMKLSVATENGQAPMHSQALQAEGGRIGATAQQAVPTLQGFVQAGKGAQALQQANSDRIQRAGAAQAEANGQAQVLGKDAAQREATVQTLSQSLQAWAQAHRTQRQAALEQTEQRIQAKGGRVIARSEG